MDDELKKSKEKIKEEREKNPTFMKKIKKKLKKLKKEDPNIYPLW